MFNNLVKYDRYGNPVSQEAPGQIVVPPPAAWQEQGTPYENPYDCLYLG